MTDAQEKDTWQKEVDDNYVAFKELLPDLLSTDAGKYVLMHKGKPVEILDTVEDAFKYARMLYKNKEPYSIQEITDRIVDLGGQGQVLL